MNNTPEISVIIPTYNAAAYIGDCIDSVIQQKCPSLEIIVVDDCSTDNTRDIVTAYDPNVVRYHCLPENFGGPARPRNVGIGLARGEYLVMLDSDDMLANDSIKLRVEALKKDPALGFVFCDGIRFSTESGDYSDTFLSQHDYFNEMLPVKQPDIANKVTALDAYRALAKGDYILPSGLAMPKAVFSTVGHYDETVKNGQDLDMSLRITEKHPIAYIDSIGFKQRVHEGSISKKGSQLAHNRIRLLEKHLANSDDKIASKAFRKRLAENYFGIGYYLRKKGDMALARKNFVKSFCYSKNWNSFKGYLSSLLGKNAG